MHPCVCFDEADFHFMLHCCVVIGDCYNYNFYNISILRRCATTTTTTTEFKRKEDVEKNEAHDSAQENGYTTPTTAFVPR